MNPAILLPGDRVTLRGNLEALGAWGPGVNMLLSPDDERVWEAVRARPPPAPPTSTHSPRLGRVVAAIRALPRPNANTNTTPHACSASRVHLQEVELPIGMDEEFIRGAQPERGAIHAYVWRLRGCGAEFAPRTSRPV